MIKVKILKENKEDKKRKIISLFSKAIESKDVKQLIKDLKNVSISPEKALQDLNRDEVDPQFYVNACHMHNEMIKLLGSGEEMKIDAFADFPKPDSDDHRTPDKDWMRSPRLPSSVAQIDSRRGEKTYYH
jgi:hypothetical protein